MLIGEGRPYPSALLVPNPDAFAQVAQELSLDPANESIYAERKGQFDIHAARARAHGVTPRLCPGARVGGGQRALDAG